VVCHHKPLLKLGVPWIKKRLQDTAIKYSPDSVCFIAWELKMIFFGFNGHLVVM
jgi:hypothetical protein